MLFVKIIFILIESHANYFPTRLTIAILSYKNAKNIAQRTAFSNLYLYFSIFDISLFFLSNTEIKRIVWFIFRFRFNFFHVESQLVAFENITVGAASLTWS